MEIISRKNIAPSLIVVGVAAILITITWFAFKGEEDALRRSYSLGLPIIERYEVFSPTGEHKVFVVAVGTEQDLRDIAVRMGSQGVRWIQAPSTEPKARFSSFPDSTWAPPKSPSSVYFAPKSRGNHEVVAASDGDKVFIEHRFTR